MTAMREDDLGLAAALCQATLSSAAERDWSERAGDLEWSCRRTLDHIVDALLFYATLLATRATERRSPVRNGDDGATIPRLIETVGSAAAILEAVARAAGPEARAFHPAGLSDSDGFRGMGCEEILLHTDDIAQGLGLTFTPPADLCQRIIARVFPWAPGATEEPDRWQALRWACGRTALPGRPRLGPDWWYQAAPLAEWDGTRNVRTSPPGWT